MALLNTFNIFVEVLLQPLQARGEAAGAGLKGGEGNAAFQGGRVFILGVIFTILKRGYGADVV